MLNQGYGTAFIIFLLIIITPMTTFGVKSGPDFWVNDGGRGADHDLVDMEKVKNQVLMWESHVRAAIGKSNVETDKMGSSSAMLDLLYTSEEKPAETCQLFFKEFVMLRMFDADTRLCMASYIHGLFLRISEFVSAIFDPELLKLQTELLSIPETHPGQSFMGSLEDWEMQVAASQQQTINHHSGHGVMSSVNKIMLDHSGLPHIDAKEQEILTRLKQYMTNQVVGAGEGETAGGLTHQLIKLNDWTAQQILMKLTDYNKYFIEEVEAQSGTNDLHAYIHDTLSVKYDTMMKSLFSHLSMTGVIKTDLSKTNIANKFIQHGKSSVAILFLASVVHSELLERREANVQIGAQQCSAVVNAIDSVLKADTCFSDGDTTTTSSASGEGAGPSDSMKLDSAQQKLIKTIQVLFDAIFTSNMGLSDLNEIRARIATEKSPATEAKKAAANIVAELASDTPNNNDAMNDPALKHEFRVQDGFFKLKQIPHFHRINILLNGAIPSVEVVMEGLSDSAGKVRHCTTTTDDILHDRMCRATLRFQEGVEAATVTPPSAMTSIIPGNHLILEYAQPESGSKNIRVQYAVRSDSINSIDILKEPSAYTTKRYASVFKMKNGLVLNKVIPFCVHIRLQLKEGHQFQPLFNGRGGGNHLSAFGTWTRKHLLRHEVPSDVESETYAGVEDFVFKIYMRPEELDTMLMNSWLDLKSFFLQFYDDEKLNLFKELKPIEKELPSAEVCRSILSYMAFLPNVEEIVAEDPGLMSSNGAPAPAPAPVTS